MSNAKEVYSKASQYYCEVEVATNSSAKIDYEHSKEREQKYNENWKKEKVNVIDIVNQYAPDAEVHVDGVKLIFDGSKNKVMCDMATGYLRIQDKATGKYYRLDGSLTKSKKRTHFKIKRLEEM